MTYLKHLSLIFILFCTLLAKPSQAIPIDSCMEEQCIAYFNKWKVMAIAKRVNAMSALAELYYQGYGTEKNLDKSLRYFRKASRYQFAYAQYRTGIFYLMEDKFIDNEAGIKYLRKAARNGHVESAFLLGVIFGTGELGIKDVGESDKWLVKALKDQHSTAQRYAGFLYKSGQVNENHYIKVNKIINNLKVTMPAMNNTKGQVAKKITEIPWPHGSRTEVITEQDAVFGDTFDFEIADLQSAASTTNNDTGSQRQVRKCEKILSCYNVDRQEF
ncbi:hypothetical protein CXF85_14530 [Colwellia sp. 75C3]|uniref:tetratricopeptide repeat protein n=1 Tax=Colwellia sp. 75C3 TaxID=888425 RepID=UPI000C31F719|nr:tetratricopeptide repeat protein [Colwellia sp. 75C3]PKG82115.1 hypothetical protein CXF85_14530 [Colwellia sp. 75C3]